MRHSRLRLLVKLYLIVFGAANGFPKECTIHLFGEHLAQYRFFRHICNRITSMVILEKDSGDYPGCNINLWISEVILTRVGIRYYCKRYVSALSAWFFVLSSRGGLGGVSVFKSVVPDDMRSRLPSINRGEVGNSRQHSTFVTFCRAMNHDYIYIYRCRHSKRCDKSVWHFRMVSTRCTSQAEHGHSLRLTVHPPG